MRTIDTEELKKLQVEMLDYFDAFCRRNNLHYWLDYGTLLGAVRHKGYIPWDDDLDVTMLRDDYEKAAKIFNAQSDGRYLFQTPVNDKKGRYPFGKLLDTTTVLYEYGEAGIKSHVYIDVFVYDNAPEEKEKRAKAFKKRDFLGRVRRLQLPLREDVRGAKKLAYQIGGLLMKPVPKSKINRSLDKNAKRYRNLPAKSVCTFVDPYDNTYFCVPKSTFEHFCEVEFEGKKYPGPENYDFWLTTLYGDYMQLPPEDKRTSTHKFEAYYTEEKK
ncbi:MAG: LicD family protein [Clostridiales bacterium]|nr:LicD family protein [Clostridiales bacterium]